MGTTGIGALGAVGKGFVSENVRIGGHLYDGNAASGDFDFDTVREGEFLKAFEIGWTPSYDRFKCDRVQFTFWHKDARDLAGIDSGSGWVVSMSHGVGEDWLPFIRFGHSNSGAGVAAKTAVSTGFEFTPRKGQALSLGLAWASPAGANPNTGGRLRDEWAIETSYMFRLARGFSLTPDVQLILNPALNTAENQVWVVGVRGIFNL
jgi:porin